MSLFIDVAARKSALSIAQVREVEKELRESGADVVFQLSLFSSTGDRDQNTSLWTLGKTDFFTKEIDAAVLEGQCRVAIHSAKDLPETFPEGISLIALTEGVDRRDALVLRDGETLSSLREGAEIGTSSPRRRDALLALRDDLIAVDIRGTVEKRLEKMDRGELDGVIVAEAALIRLGLTAKNRIYLPGETTPLQGQLAVVAKQEDQQMLHLFARIDSRCPVSSI